MNHLDMLLKSISQMQRKRKKNNTKDFLIYGVLAGVIVGVAAVLLVQSHLDEIENIFNNNADSADKDIDIKRNEIKQTLEEVGSDTMGDVGVAMEKALEDVKTDKQS